MKKRRSAEKTSKRGKRRTVRGPQMELVRERKSKGAGPAVEFELLPYVSDNEATEARGAAKVLSFRMPSACIAELDAMVAAHVGATRTAVIQKAIAALSKRGGK